MRLENIDAFNFIDFYGKEEILMYFLSGVIALIGAALVMCLAPLSYGLLGPSLVPNSAPLDYGGLIAIGFFLLALYCFYLHNKEKNQRKIRIKISKQQFHELLFFCVIGNFNMIS